jgi:hypothetical protein
MTQKLAPDNSAAHQTGNQMVFMRRAASSQDFEKLVIDGAACVPCWVACAIFLASDFASFGLCVTAAAKASPGCPINWPTAGRI